MRAYGLLADYFTVRGENVTNDSGGIALNDLLALPDANGRRVQTMTLFGSGSPDSTPSGCAASRTNSRRLSVMVQFVGFGAGTV